MATDYIRSRPHTALGYCSPVEYVDTDTKLAGDFALAPGFKENLEAFYPKASVEDKARCLELMTSLDIGSAIKEQSKDLPFDPLCNAPPACVQAPRPPQRPKSAMSYYNRGKVDVMNPYTTSYKVDYQEKPMLTTQADRPKSTRNYHASYELSGPVGVSSYQSEYYKKKDSKPSPMPVEIASENRNNPHPLESFMVWKLPRNATNAPTSGPQLTDEKMDKVCRGTLTSTYQQDYLGIPQGCNAFIEERLAARDDKTHLPYTLDSIMRHSYQQPTQQPELKGNNTRYGCNKKKHIAVHGAVPTVSKKNNFLNLKTRTTYEREYNDYYNPAPTEVRDLAKQYGTQSLKRYYARAATPERESIRKMLQTISDGKPQQPPPNFGYYSPHASEGRIPSRQYSPAVRTPSRQSSHASSRGRVYVPMPPTACLESPTGARDAWEPALTGQISQHAY